MNPRMTANEMEDRSEKSMTQVFEENDYTLSKASDDRRNTKKTFNL